VVSFKEGKENHKCSDVNHEWQKEIGTKETIFFFHIDIVLGTSKKKHHSLLNFDRSCIKFLFPRLVDANFTASRWNEPSTFEALFYFGWFLLPSLSLLLLHIKHVTHRFFRA
jgi:hypothetical protein